MNSNMKPYYLHGAGEITALTAEKLTFEAINAVFTNVLTKVGVNVVKSAYHEFPGGGLSIVYILSASHLAIHTWPEADFMHFDLITCSPKADFEEFKQLLQNAYPQSEIKASLLDY